MVRTSFRSLKCIALTWRTFSFVVKDTDGEVVDAVGVEAGQSSFATVPLECQDLLPWLLLRLGLVKSTLAAVVHLNRAMRGWIQSKEFNTQGRFPTGPCIPAVSRGQRTEGRAPSATPQACCYES